jgi:hypothetical protein
MHGAFPAIFISGFCRAFRLEREWVQLEPDTSLTPEEEHRIRYAGICRLCETRGNWWVSKV